VNINKAEIDKGSGGAQTSSGSTLSLHNRASFRQSLSTPNSPQVSRMDTYVKIQLLPDKKRKYQTKIQRKTSNPVFEETFYFATPFNELQNRTLYLAVYEFGRFLKHELIGAIRINELHLIKDINTQDVEFIRNLQNLAEVNNFFKCIFFKCQQKPIIMFLRNVFRY
jgi:Ca2+-dependent lipid-binding protein